MLMVARTKNASRSRDTLISGITGIVMIIICMMIILSAVACAVLMRENKEAEHEISRVMEYNTVLDGVYINNMDISGLTKEEAYAATANLSESLLAARQFSVDVNGTYTSLTASELSMSTDYDEIIQQALSYGHTGSFEDRKHAAEKAKNEGVHFIVSIRAVRESVAASLLLRKDDINLAPVDAGYSFMPNGYFADGTPFDPQIEATATSALVRVPEEDMANPLRYQYYRTKSYVNHYLPSGAGISRFIYTEEASGYDVDFDELAQQLMKALEYGDSMITAKTVRTPPKVTAKDIKHVTRLLTSWTSSYESLDDANRNYNIAKLSGMINGVVIEPGQVWSINEQAGPRTQEKGWKDAPGINRGAIVLEPGGGVCQISSTLYNAALRAGLEIVESSRHSIISSYIPIGLDATISTHSPDLKLKNPNDTPVFIVSYVNEKDKNVTVEVFGPPVMDKEHGEVVIDFSSEIIGYTDMPETVVHHHAKQTPDGKPLKPGESRLYVKPRKGTKVQVYIHYLLLDGSEARVKKLYKTSYRAYTGQKYVND